nr:hypothetical protein [Streptomyces chartreusis]
MRVRLQGFAAQGVDDVVAEDLRLAHGVLGVGGAVRAGLGGRDVGDGGGVARGPRVRGAVDGQLGGAFQPAARIEWQVARREDRVGFDAGRPHDRASGEAGPVAEDGDTVGAGLQAGVQAYVDVAAAQFGDGVAAHVLADLGQDPVGGLDQDPLHVLGPDVVVVARGVAGHVLQFAERFDTGVAAADEDEGEGGVADLGVAGGGGDVHLLDDVVAQADGLFDGLEADGVIGEAGDGQGARDGAGGEDEFVVRQLFGARALLLGGEGGEGGGALGVVDGGGLADDDPALGQDAAQRYDHMAGRDRAGRRFGQERLIGHVRVGSDHGDLGFTPTEFRFQPPLETQGRVHPDVAAADNENARTFLHHPMTHPTLAFVHRLDNLCDRRPTRPRFGRIAGVRGVFAGQWVCAGGSRVAQRGRKPPVLRSRGAPCGTCPF